MEINFLQNKPSISENSNINEKITSNAISNGIVAGLTGIVAQETFLNKKIVDTFKKQGSSPEEAKKFIKEIPKQRMLGYMAATALGLAVGVFKYVFDQKTKR
ncbi:MAG TPA: hypothetical protein P5556_07630 [Candidatus Gastranaerophilales bacterium]|nr:hypothetical protein [Candidatus Gastranaerophilales bacterium]